MAFWLGRWWQHRSESGWEHGQNIHKNPHYRVATQVPSPMGLPESNFIYFYHPDYLGSTSFVTDGDGEIYEHVQYFPHGEIWADERSNTERLPYLFTGKELDQETGLYDFGARQYDPRVGVWLSPDPALGEEFLPGAGVDGQQGLPAGGVFTPVNLNGYVYGGNNPIKYVDRDGRFITFAIVTLAAVAASYALPATANSKGPGEANNPHPTDLEQVATEVSAAVAAYYLVKSLVAPEPDRPPPPPEPDTPRAGHNGVHGPVKQAARTTRGGDKAVRQTFPDGSVKDISPKRVKEFVPNNHPSAPAGAKQKVKFDNAQPGSKGFKRDPTPDELQELL